MARFLADLEGKKKAEYKIHTLAGTIIPVVNRRYCTTGARNAQRVSTACGSCRPFAVAAVDLIARPCSLPHTASRPSSQANDIFSTKYGSVGIWRTLQRFPR